MLYFREYHARRYLLFSFPENRNNPEILFFTVEAKLPMCESLASPNGGLSDVRERRDVNPSRHRPEGNAL